MCLVVRHSQRKCVTITQKKMWNRLVAFPCGYGKCIKNNLHAIATHREYVPIIGKKQKTNPNQIRKIVIINYILCKFGIDFFLNEKFSVGGIGGKYNRSNPC